MKHWNWNLFRTSLNQWNSLAPMVQLAQTWELKLWFLGSSAQEGSLKLRKKRRNKRLPCSQSVKPWSRDHTFWWVKHWSNMVVKEAQIQLVKSHEIQLTIPNKILTYPYIILTIPNKMTDVKWMSDVIRKALTALTDLVFAGLTGPGWWASKRRADATWWLPVLKVLTVSEISHQFSISSHLEHRQDRQVMWFFWEKPLDITSPLK